MDFDKINHAEIYEELCIREEKGKKSSDNRKLSQINSRALHKELLKQQKLVYGVDDRKDLYEITDSQILSQADSTAGIFDLSRIIDNQDGTSTLRTLPFSVAQNLCSSETFYNQPTGPFCTAFLVAEDIVATAGHCIKKADMLRARFVFGFEMINKDQAKLRVKNEDIYTAQAIIDRKLEFSNSDYALVKLDRPVKNRKVLPVRRKGKIRLGDPVYVIGHPSGLPLKFADGAKVLENNEKEYFKANLDTYGGNSGSPVFNEKTGVVEGILVRGDTDFVNIDGCWVSNVIPSTGEGGEGINRISDFVDKIPESEPNLPLNQDKFSVLEQKLLDILKELEALRNESKKINGQI